MAAVAKPETEMVQNRQFIPTPLSRVVVVVVVVDIDARNT